MPISQPTIVMEQYYSRKEIYSPIAIFWVAQKPSETLAKVLRLTHIPETLPLDQIVEITQKEWLRTGERALTVDSPEFKAIQPLMLQYAADLQLKKTIEPKYARISFALVFGSKLAVFEKRLNSLLERIAKGSIRADILSILSGERTLDKDEIEALEKMGCAANDEREMMEFIANKRVAEFRRIHPNLTFQLEIIKAPKKEGAARATTEDTLIAWKALHPAPPQYPVLLTSSQPYGIYQFLVANGVLPEFELDLLAAETAESRTAIYLDTLARILFLIKKTS